MENSELPQKIKVFQLTQKNFSTAGITANLVTNSYPLNAKILLGFLILGSAIVCNFKYTFYEAKTFIEYTQSVYMGSMATIIILVLLILINHVKKLFEFINGIESVANTS